jgi:hypothetical protein
MDLHSHLWNDVNVSRFLTMISANKAQQSARKHHALALLRFYEAQCQGLRQEIWEAERKLQTIEKNNLPALKEYVSQLPNSSLISIP